MLLGYIIMFENYFTCSALLHHKLLSFTHLTFRDLLIGLVPQRSEYVIIYLHHSHAHTIPPPPPILFPYTHTQQVKQGGA